MQSKNVKAGYKHELEFLITLLQQNQRILEDAHATIQIAADLLRAPSGSPRKQEATQK